MFLSIGPGIRRLVQSSSIYLSLLWTGAAAAQTPMAADPAMASAAVPETIHQPLFEGFKSIQEIPVGNWRAANDTVGQIGGWRAYAREAQRSSASPTLNAAPADRPDAPKHSAGH